MTEPLPLAGNTILAERNATVAKSSINFGGVLLLNELSYRPQFGPIKRSVSNLQNETKLKSVALFVEEQRSSKVDASFSNCRFSFRQDSSRMRVGRGCI